MRTTLISLTRSLIVATGLAVMAGCGGDSGNIAQNETPSNASYGGVAVADLNNDGKLDIVTSFTLGNGSNPFVAGYVAVYLRDPSSASMFSGPTNYRVADHPTGVAIADLNGDGKPDIVTVNFTGPGGVSVLLQDGTGSAHFLPAVNYALSHSGALAIADINGDGKPDLAVDCDEGISILFQDPSRSGTFLPPTTIKVGGGEVTIAAADLNGDGKTDLVVPYTGVMVLLQNPTAPGTFFSPVEYAAGGGVWGLAVGDLNGDDKPDIAATYSGNGENGITPGLSVLLQNPASPGTFLPGVNYATVPYPGVWSFVAIADLNGDGKSDVVVADHGTTSGSCTSSSCNIVGSGPSVFLQDPAHPGTLQPAVNYLTTDDWVTSVAIGDMNGDGRPDLVFTYLGDGVVIRFQSSSDPGKFLGETFITK
jgi:hypothetical protein